MRTEKRTTRTIVLNKSDIETLAKSGMISGEIIDGDERHNVRFAESITLTFVSFCRTGE